MSPARFERDQGRAPNFQERERIAAMVYERYGLTPP